MIGRKVLLPVPPQRIISLVPSQTELLYVLGAADKIVGQTIFCVHPEIHFKDAAKVGGTKKIKYDVIHSLNPDLVICNKEENTEDIVNQLSERYPVWVSDIKNVDDACHMILSLGEIVDSLEKAESLVNQIRENFLKATYTKKRSCIYLIWKNPYMAAGTDTFIQQMLLQAGFNNLMPENSRYPELDIDEIMALNPEILLLSSEPYPFREKDILEFRNHLPSTKIIIVNGEFFSWYGSRLVNSQFYFNEIQALLNTAD